MTPSEDADLKIPTPLVETTWLAEHLQDSDLRVLDCSVVMVSTGSTYRFTGGRSQWEAGHIPGSVFVDVLEELSDRSHTLPLMMPPMPVFAERMASYGVGNDSTVVLYDRSNHAWAARVWWMLRASGFESAAVLNGGWHKWTREGRQSTLGSATYPAGEFTPNPSPRLFADKREVVGALLAKQVSLINALSPEQHRGEKTNLARPGRIPGSENVYCQSLIDNDTNTYLPAAELRQIFAATKALSAERVIIYCGGGIAASSDALALTLLGVENVAVYDGSLAEWTADPALPMEMG
jgi:thiosulfate/3-mercaptopyruvate sulfurtransferase